MTAVTKQDDDQSKAETQPTVEKVETSPQNEAKSTKRDAKQLWTDAKNLALSAKVGKFNDTNAIETTDQPM